jgi:hypothetical protein
MNGDGIPDLVSSQEGNPSSILIVAGKEDGTFVTPLATVPLSNPASQAFVADFNGDGLPDIALGSFGDPGPLYVASKGLMGPIVWCKRHSHGLLRFYLPAI